MEEAFRLMAVKRDVGRVLIGQDDRGRPASRLDATSLSRANDGVFAIARSADRKQLRSAKRFAPWRGPYTRATPLR